MASDLNGRPLTADMVQKQADAGQRDVSIEIFPGLDALYRTKDSIGASTLIRSIDKDPSEFLNWVHWNNASLFTSATSVRRGTTTLLQADRAMMGRFLNTAHRSTYWTQHLTALAASTANAVPLEGRIFPSYPHYLRRSAPSGFGSVVEKLAELSGTNKATTREEFLQPLNALLSDDSPLGDSSDIQLSIELGISAEEHLALAGLAKSRRSSKALIKTYEEAEHQHRTANRPEPDKQVVTKQPTPVSEVNNTMLEAEQQEETNGQPPGQTKLF